MTQRILHNKEFFANAVLLLTAVSLLADMALPGTRHTAAVSSTDRTLCHLIQITILGMMTIFVCGNYTLPRIPAVMFWEVSLFVFLSLSVCQGLFASGREQLVTLTKFVYWPIGYFFFRLLRDEVRGYTKPLSCLLVALSIFAVWAYVSQADLRAELAARAGNAGLASSNVGWTLLSIFDISLCLIAAGSGKGYIIGGIALLLVPLSLKRGAIVAEAVLLVCLLLASYRLGRLREYVRRNARWLVAGVLVWVFVCASYLPWVVTRFSNLAQDGGSGRSQIYLLLYDRWRTADLFHWLFGFGFWSSPEYLGSIWLQGIYAHSDVLELLHDYGVLGVLSYGMILVGFLALCQYTWRHRDEGIVIAASVSGLFLAGSLVSGAVMFRETLYLMIPLGYMVGRLEKVREARDVVPVNWRRVGVPCRGYPDAVW